MKIMRLSLPTLAGNFSDHKTISFSPKTGSDTAVLSPSNLIENFLTQSFRSNQSIYVTSVQCQCYSRMLAVSLNIQAL